MKSLLAIVVLAAFFMTSCKRNAQETVREFVSAINRSDKHKITELTAANFAFGAKDGDKSDSSEFLKELDEMKKREINYSLIAINGADSIVTTKERLSTILDSLLQVKPNVILHKTYKVKDGKITSIALDTSLYYKEHEKALDEKLVPFGFWAADVHSDLNPKELSKNLVKYLVEYNQLSVPEKRKYKTYGGLQGTYVSKRNPFYRKLVFKGKSTVVIVDALLGFSFPSSYVVDEDYIRIRTDKSDLLLRIKDNHTLVGEGFAEGVFKKQGS